MVKGYKYSQSLCKFLDGVVCPHKRTARQRKRFSVNRFCFTCPYYGQYVTIMEEEDDRIMDGIDRLHEIRERFDRGKISEGEFHRLYDLINREMDGEVV